MAKKANYSVEELTDKAITLRDVGPHHQYMTITNAVESVVDEICQQYGPDIGGRRLLYLDSDNELTEIIVRNGKFVRFSFPQDTL